jgi:hypothetical protein
MAKPGEKRIAAIGEKIQDLLDDLDRQSCPACGQKTLGIDHVRRSGIRINCEGFSPHAPEGACEYTVYFLGTATDDLPKIEPAKAE